MLESGIEIQRWPIDINEVIIGRSEKADIVIDGSSVSRRYVRLWLEDGIVVAEDPGSRNGIKINGVRTRSGSLQDGDQMEVEKHFFVVTSLDAEPISLKDEESLEPAPNPEFRAVQKRALQNLDVRLNAALSYAGRLQPYLFDSDALFKRMGKIILSDVPAQRCYILGASSGKRGLTTLALASKNGTADGPALNTTIVDHVFRECKAVIVGDVSEVPTVSSEGEVKTGVICVPFVSEKKAVGVLYVDSAWEPSRFVSANLEDMKAYGLAFGTLVEHTVQIKAGLAEAEMHGVVQATSAIGKCLHEQFDRIRDAAKDGEGESLSRVLRRSDQVVQQMIGLANIRLTSRRPLDFNHVIEKAIGDLKKDIDARGVRVDFDISGRVLPDNPGQWRGDVADAVREPDGKCGGQRGSGDERDHDGACFLGGEIARRTMSVRSEEGSGTMVTIRLPQQQSAAATPGA